MESAAMGPFAARGASRNARLPVTVAAVPGHELDNTDGNAIIARDFSGRGASNVGHACRIAGRESGRPRTN